MRNCCPLRVAGPPERSVSRTVCGAARAVISLLLGHYQVDTTLTFLNSLTPSKRFKIYMVDSTRINNPAAILFCYVEKANKFISTFLKLPRWSEHLLYWAFIAWVTNSQFARQFAPVGGVTPNPTGQYIIWINHLLLSILSFAGLGYYVVPRFWYHSKPLQATFLFALYWFLSCWETEIVFNLVSTHYTPIPKYVDSRVILFEQNSWMGL